jgi:PAS domain S-box-containing protein
VPPPGTTERAETSAGGDQLRPAIETVPIGMVMVDRAGIIVLVNAQAERIFGYTRDELIGTSIERLVPERHRPRHPGYRAVFAQDPKPRSLGAGRELFGLRKDGTEVPVEIGLNPFVTADRELVLSSIVDITERRRAQEEREALLEKLRQLNVELEERVSLRTVELTTLLREKEVLLQEVHHRVKNNLQVISSLINMQRRHLGEGSAAVALEDCQSRIQTIALIHEQLYQEQDFSRVSFADYARSLAENVFAVTGVSRSRVALDLQVADIALAVDRAIPCGLILNELISNALKHAFPGTRKGTVTVEMRSAGERLELTVRDDGVGLPSELDLVAAESLGLKLVSTLVEQLSGRLERGYEGGASFRLEFPCQ